MEITLKIEGMMCPHCEARAKKALESVAGVESAAVSHVSGSAVVCGTKVSNEALAAAIEAAGYKVVSAEENN